MKVIDKIRENNKSCSDRVVFSFEFFPPKTEDGVDNLFERMDRMVSHSPSFCDITWGAGGSTAELTLEIANKMQNMICVETMMHLTCTNMPVEKIDLALQTIKSNGIQNVLALRGDPPHGQDKFVQIQGGFACALDLVKHIRSAYGDYFGITVAGYPEAHPDAIGPDGLATLESYQNELLYLKKKVDAGADLIVTQLFYDTDIFLKFVNDCRQIGITCPIVPGIMPINNYKGFLRMTGFCKSKIPAEVTAALEPIKDNEEAVKAYGIHLGTEMCKKILAHGIKTVHLYTLNMEKSALAILMNLGLIEESKISRSLPWRRPTNGFHVKEDVRPIFWANCPKSYIYWNNKHESLAREGANKNKQKKHELTSRNRGQSSRMVSDGSEIVFIGSSGESCRPGSSTIQSHQNHGIVEIDELSPDMRHGNSQGVVCINDDDSAARARQAEADEMLALRLQEQLYHELPAFGGDEIDADMARLMQEEEAHPLSNQNHHASNPRTLSINSRRQPQSRLLPNPSNRRGIRARSHTSSGMEHLRNRILNRSRAASSRARNLQFPLGMDLDMRLDILEALEAAVGDLSNTGTTRHISELKRDFNENDYEMLLALDENNHQSGASTNQINSLPLSTVQNDNFGEACAICLDTPAIGEPIRHLPCMHKFHKDEIIMPSL